MELLNVPVKVEPGANFAWASLMLELISWYILYKEEA